MKVVTQLTLLSVGLLLVAVVNFAITYVMLERMGRDGNVVNYAGRQRAISQRYTKMLFAGKEAGASEKEMAELSGRLDQIVRGLVAGDRELDLPPASDRQFVAKMGEVAAAWSDLKQNAARFRNDPVLLQAVYVDSERFLRVADEATTLVAKQADKKAGAVKAVQVAILVFFAAILVTNLLMSRIKIARPLRELALDMERVAKGDLTVSFKTTARDEIGDLRSSLDTMVQHQREILATVQGSAREVSTAAAGLQAASHDIAQAAEAAAVQTVTVATASEEMAATSGEIAQNCMLAAENAQKANDSVVEGAAVVSETVMTMQGIAEKVKEFAQAVAGLGERSRQISGIIETIEGIADQTNLLALNAAIEAARAGEQGRGFAVVADEVRSLAERTTGATREITAMIQVIQGDTAQVLTTMEAGAAEVEGGAQDAVRSCDILSQILDQIDAVAEQVRQIATAAEQQTATTNQISGHIQDITDMVQKTAKGADTTATAATQLTGMASGLQQQMEEFIIS